MEMTLNMRPPPNSMLQTPLTPGSPARSTWSQIIAAFTVHLENE